MFTKILHGGDYNPEQWPEDVWDEDVRLMQLAHVNVATLPVFGWVSLQPDEDTFTFGWLDTVIGKLTAGGVGLCLATATGSVPAWVDQKYPDILRVNNNGVKLKHGNRHSFCPNSPNFRRLSVNLTREIARRYSNHPGLLVWHIGNEYSPTCYCDQCASAFRTWLQARYGSLDELNSRWYTRFWGHTYTNWEQIEPPITIGERSIQPLSIDYDRFQSQSLLNCYCAERDAIREFSKTTPITTNLMATCRSTDYQKWGKELDVISWDSYPQRGAVPSEMAFNHSLMRGCKEGQPWMLMEQTPSQQNWQKYNALKRPGVMRLWSYQAMAHGADAVMYFQWRRGRGGCEKFHGAVVEHAARTDVRVFQEVAQLGSELEALGQQTLSGWVHSDTALLFDWDTWWALDYSIGPSIDLKYVPQAHTYYAALHTGGVVADVVNPDADLSKYKVIVAPAMYMVKPGVADKLKAFVQNGGTFVTTYFSGIVDETDIVFEGGYPGPLRDLLGIWVEEQDVLSPAESNSVQFQAGPLAGQSVPCGLLCERMRTEGATVLGSYATDFYAGEPAVTVNAYGKGRAYYLGTKLDDAALQTLFVHITDEAGVTLPLGQRPPAGVEAVTRRAPSGAKVLYVLNHTPETVQVPLNGRGRKELLSGETVSGTLDLPAYGVALLQDV